EQASTAIKREFIEEAMNSNPDAAAQIEDLFQLATSAYKGYVDDPRNTGKKLLLKSLQN
ncbi:unnamed protein product, partial [Rotaria sp. Silwood1]